MSKLSSSYWILVVVFAEIDWLLSLVAKKAGVLDAKPVAVPLLVSVAPLGIVIVSPEEPISKAVPDCGSNLSTNKVAILYYR